jgi:hypothetical protein
MQVKDEVSNEMSAAEEGAQFISAELAVSYQPSALRKTASGADLKK